MKPEILRRLGPYFIHGPTLRRLGLGENTKTAEHKQRGIEMRGCFRGNHAHSHGRRWPNERGCPTAVYRRNHPPKREGAICFCIPPKATHPNRHPMKTLTKTPMTDAV